MENVNFIFPHQLFEHHPLLQNGFPIYLIEEHLFFNQYAFHKQKIAFHRASMKAFGAFLEAQRLSVNYIEANIPSTPDRDEILSFIANSQRGIMKGFTRMKDNRI